MIIVDLKDFTMIIVVLKGIAMIKVDLKVITMIIVDLLFVRYYNDLIGYALCSGGRGGGGGGRCGVCYHRGCRGDCRLQKTSCVHETCRSGRRKSTASRHDFQFLIRGR